MVSMMGGDSGGDSGGGGCANDNLYTLMTKSAIDFLWSFFFT